MVNVDKEAQNVIADIDRNSCLNSRRASQAQSVEFLDMLIDHCQLLKENIESDIRKQNPNSNISSEQETEE